MTRIMRLRVPVRDAKEWVSVLPGSDSQHVLVVRESGDEIELSIDSEQPLEPQLSRELTNLTAAL